MKKWQEAEDAFNKALRLDPSSSEAMECMGSLFLDRDGGMEGLPIARKWLLRALQINKTARAFTLLGAICKALGDRDAARDAFRNALQVDESYEEAYFNIALLEKDTNPQHAAASLEKAVELDPNYSDAHQQLGILLQKEGKLLEAEYHFRRCLEVDAADYWSLLYLANVLAVQDRQEMAEEKYHAAIDSRPNDRAAYEFFAKWLDDLSRSKEAELVRQRLGDLGVED